jgi:hypothetical protein
LFLDPKSSDDGAYDISHWTLSRVF